MYFTIYNMAVFANTVPLPPPPSIALIGPPSADIDQRPVDLWGHFDPPPLPTGLLPPIIEQFALTLAYHMGADPAGLAMSALTVCAAAIPDIVRVQMKRHDTGWVESPRIWTALIGLPSTKKSPIISAAMSPLAKIDGDLVRKWMGEHARWSALEKAERAATPEPLQRRHRVEDTTVEALQEVLRGSPEGVLCVRDELSGWFGSMEKYAGGKASASDRAVWLQAFNGGEYAMNRVGRGVTLIPNLSVSLLGGVQPDAIRRIAGDATDDGLLQRLFPIVLRPATVGHDAPMPSTQAQYDLIIRCLVRLQCAAPLQFDDKAQVIRRWLEQRHASLMAAEMVHPKLASHIGKLDGLFGRLCVVWHCIEHAYSPKLPEIISEATAWRVGAFLGQFLLPHAACFYGGVLGLSEDHDRLQAVAAYILAKGLNQIDVRDVQRGTRAMRKIANADVRPLLEQLVALGWLAAIRDPAAPMAGYAVNPHVHTLYADRGQREQMRMDAARAAMASIFGR